VIVKVAFNGFYMLKKTMKFQGKRIAVLLFSVYFLSYVLSPFCLAEDGIPESSLTSYKTNHNEKNIRVIWELILSNFFHEKNENENSRSNVQILIKKGRALVSSGNFVKLSPSGSAEFDYNDIIFPLKYYSSSDQHTKPEYQTGSYLSVSGLSPPSLS